MCVHITAVHDHSGSSVRYEIHPNPKNACTTITMTAFGTSSLKYEPLPENEEEVCLVLCAIVAMTLCFDLVAM